MAEKHLVVLKLLFTYSEDVFLSKYLDDEILDNENLKLLAQMNTISFGLDDNPSDYHKLAHSVALEEFAINNLPEPPNLLAAEFALQR